MQSLSKSGVLGTQSGVLFREPHLCRILRSSGRDWSWRTQQAASIRHLCQRHLLRRMITLADSTHARARARTHTPRRDRGGGGIEYARRRSMAKTSPRTRSAGLRGADFAPGHRGVRQLVCASGPAHGQRTVSIQSERMDEGSEKRPPSRSSAATSGSYTCARDKRMGMTEGIHMIVYPNASQQDLRCSAL